jgi:hypothetical protein
MKKEKLLKYKNHYIYVGVPHFYEKNRLFLYKGYLTDLDDETITVTADDGEEILINYDRIKQLKASGSSHGASGQ